MLVMEHHAKLILSKYGIPIPRGILVKTEVTADDIPFPAPWFVKAQVPTGGRGKEGGIKRVDSAEKIPSAVAGMIGSRLKGHSVRECRIEEAVTAGREVYVSFSVEPQTALVRVLISAAGGVDVEDASAGNMLRGTSPPTEQALTSEVARLTARLPGGLRDPVRQAGTLLAALFLELEATLLEINPLFVLDDGTWLAGDAKLIVDDNALVRQPDLSELLREQPEAYPDTAFKLRRGFDFIVLDREGEIGLVTTGAGLSMKLIDELIDQGSRPFNFCDIRTGQMRGDPARLIHVLKRMAEGPNIRAVLVNIFAGITDLAEFAQLLVQALNAVPELKVPVIVRLVGNGEAEAAVLLKDSRLPLILEPELDRAVALAARRSIETESRHA